MESITINKKSSPTADHPRAGKIFFAVFFLLIIGSVAATYYRYIIARDYIVEAEAECDPTTEDCFVWECDPSSTEEGEACAGDPEEDVWYYTILRRNAKNVPLCDPNDEDCDALTCPEGEEECEIVYCTDETKGEEDTCSTPDEYLAEHPDEEEEEEGDAEGEEGEGGEEDVMETDEGAAMDAAKEDAGTDAQADTGALLQIESDVTAVAQ